MTFETWHRTHDRWQVTCDIWHTLGGDHCLKIAGCLLLRFWGGTLLHGLWLIVFPLGRSCTCRFFSLALVFCFILALLSFLYHVRVSAGSGKVDGGQVLFFFLGDDFKVVGAPPAAWTGCVRAVLLYSHPCKKRGLVKCFRARYWSARDLDQCNCMVWHPYTIVA